MVYCNENVAGVAGAPSAPLPLPLAGNTEGTEEDDGRAMMMKR